MHTPYMISTPGGKIFTRQVVVNPSLNLEGRVYKTCLIVLEGQGIDVILGMNRMTRHGALLDTIAQIVHLDSPEHGGVSHPVFKTKIRCSSYVCPGSSCHTYGQNVSTEYQCLYYIVSYYKNLLEVQKGLNSGMDPILPQAVDRGFCTPRRNLHPHTPHLLSSRT
jgi:hypothetical protein